MGIKKYVTDFEYLDLSFKRQPYIPKLLKKPLDQMLPVAIRILGVALGFGRKTQQAVRLPECHMKLSDGTRLAMDVYLPKKVIKARSKCPTILVRMPYWKDNFNFIGYAYASYGFAVVIQDIRGTGHSEGMNFILIPDRQDGLETLKWITKQFWYDGKIGMSGASYFGLTQWCVSWDNDNLLTTICPAVSANSNMMRMHGGLNIHSLINAFKKILINVTIHRDSPRNDTFTNKHVDLLLDPSASFYNDKIDVNKPKLSHFEGLPIETIVKFIKRMFKLKELNLSKRNYEYFFVLLDRLLENIDINHEKMFGMLDLDVTKISQPVFMLAGWYDLFLEHTLKDYLEIKKNGKGIAKEHSRIMIGPFAHAAVGGKTNKLDNGLLNFLRGFIAKEWYMHWLMEKEYPEMKKPPIKYYVLGLDKWRYSYVWPPERSMYKDLYLHSKGKANTRDGDGRLSFKAPADESEDLYNFDPIDPVITKGGRNLEISKGALDQEDSEMRDDVLVYTSEPFDHGVEVTGDVKIVLYASSSAKDTDFMVKLVDVSPKGKAILILDAGIRARFRNGHDNPELIEPGEVVKYEFLVGNISTFFKPGHRIRVDITSSNFPRYDVNSNMGGEGKEGEFLIAEQKIYHNKKFPTHLILPIYI